jgi:membrane protein YqaA with SNARE-associated domain
MTLKYIFYDALKSSFIFPILYKGYSYKLIMLQNNKLFVNLIYISGYIFGSILNYALGYTLIFFAKKKINSKTRSIIQKIKVYSPIIYIVAPMIDKCGSILIIICGYAKAKNMLFYNILGSILFLIYKYINYKLNI